MKAYFVTVICENNRTKFGCFEKELTRSKIGYYYKSLFSHWEEVSIERVLIEKMGMRYEVTFRENKYCRENFNQKYWRNRCSSYYSASSHREVLCNRLFCNVTSNRKKYQGWSSVYAFLQTCFIKSFDREFEEQLLVAAYWLLIIDICFFI